MNRALRTSAWDTEGDVTIEVVYEDTKAKSKWSVSVRLTSEQAASFADRLTYSAKLAKKVKLA